MFYWSSSTFSISISTPSQGFLKISNIKTSTKSYIKINTNIYAKNFPDINLFPIIPKASINTWNKIIAKNEFLTRIYLEIVFDSKSSGYKKIKLYLSMKYWYIKRKIKINEIWGNINEKKSPNVIKVTAKLDLKLRSFCQCSNFVLPLFFIIF